MANDNGVTIHVEAEQGDEAALMAKAGLTCVGVVVAILGGAFLWLGRAGMLDPHSPDFFPLPHFCAFAGLMLAIFFFVRAFIHGRRFLLFGTSVVEASAPALGESFAGTLRIAKVGALTSPIMLRLCCDWRHYTEGLSSVSRSREVTETLWEDVLELNPVGATMGITFRFEIPQDGLASGRRPRPKSGVHPGSPGQIIWVLRALSRRRGTDYYAEFEIPVRRRKAIAEQASPAVHASTRRGVAVAMPGSHRATRALGEILAGFVGGRVPSAGELRSEAAADARSEPAQPFASRPWSDPTRLQTAGRIALGVAFVLTLIAIYALSRQAVFGWHGAELPATITKVERNLVTLDLGVDDHNHPISVSAFHHWNVGQPVSVLCVTDVDGRRRCRMTSGFDRWLEGLVTLGVALIAFTIARRTRRV